MASSSQGACRVGVDIGGTFTDLILVDDTTGALTIGKVLTTPGDPSRAVEAVLEEALEQAGVPAGEVRHLVHGTTLVTNAIIERKGARTALLATRGFRDSIEIGKEHRYELYDLMVELPKPLVPRYLRFDVPQRTLADGTIEEELDVAYVERLARELRASGVEAVAISFLHSFTNPEPSALPARQCCAPRRSCGSRSPPRSSRRSASTSAAPRPWRTCTSRGWWSVTCGSSRLGWSGSASAAASSSCSPAAGSPRWTPRRASRSGCWNPARPPGRWRDRKS